MLASAPIGMDLPPARKAKHVAERQRGKGCEPDLGAVKADNPVRPRHLSFLGAAGLPPTLSFCQQFGYLNGVQCSPFQKLIAANPKSQPIVQGSVNSEAPDSACIFASRV